MILLNNTAKLLIFKNIAKFFAKFLDEYCFSFAKFLDEYCFCFARFLDEYCFE